MNTSVASLIGGILIEGTTDSHHADDDREVWSGEIVTDVANQLREKSSVAVVSSRLLAVRVNPPIDHVVPTLEPDQSRELNTIFQILIGIEL